MVLPVLSGLIARGIDPSSLLREVGIDPRALGDCMTRFPDESVQALWLRAPDYASDPDFGLFAAKLYRRGLFWVLDDLVACAKDLRDAFELGHAHLRLLHDAADARLVAQGPLTRLEILPNSPAPIARAQSEFFIGCLMLGARMLTGKYEHPREVHFRHPRPVSQAKLEDFFECPLYFGAEVSAVVFPSEWLELPILSNDAAALRAVEKRASALLASVSARFDVITRVRLLIGADIERSEPRLENVARRLAMSARTLRRRLQDAGTSYSEQVDVVRQRYAARYLLDGSSIDHTAQRLGFANSTAFFKAHKRWTGLTPGEVRDSQDVRLLGVTPDDGEHDREDWRDTAGVSA